MTAIRATFSDFRTVKSRKVAQLVMEVPIEAADEALRALGGVPRPDREQWVAVAPLTEEAAQRPAEKERRAWGDLSCAEQAGIRCNDPEFWAWIGVKDADEAAASVRAICEVSSRAHLDVDVQARQRWRKIDNDFLARNMR